jgi:hypothetical protein
MNNYEKIKQMTVEEMAEYFSFISYCGCCPAKDTEKCNIECKGVFKQWLLQEVEE